jgi:hypothetical protein
MTAMNESLDSFSINDGASFSDEDLIVVHTVNLTCCFLAVQNIALMNFFQFYDNGSVYRILNMYKNLV